jgi:hypothetical protein
VGDRDDERFGHGLGAAPTFISSKVRPTGSRLQRLPPASTSVDP